MGLVKVTRGGGEVNPPVVSNQNIFFWKKREKIQNVLKRKNMYFYEKIAKYIHLGLFYVLDYYGSFEFFEVRKNRFFPYGGG